MSAGSGYVAAAPSTVEELSPAEVRWFYQEEKDKPLQALCGADSLRVEVSFRLKTGLPMPPAVRASVGASVASTELLPVLGGLYHAHVETLTLSAIYWEASAKLLLRGTWFRGADQRTPFSGRDPKTDAPWTDLLEAQHLAIFKGQRIPSGTSAFLTDKGKRPELAKLAISGNEEVLWSSPIDIQYRYNDLRSRISRTLRASSGTEALRRGYPTLAQLSDGPKPIGHLIFVVHGIGQIASSQDILDLTHKVQKVLDTTMSSQFAGTETRPLLLPVQWRKGLELDHGLVESITLHTHSYYRGLINDSLMDIMYYLAPRFNREIRENVVQALSSLYKQFTTLHPDFVKNKGQVSIFAHSLGGVITYDILENPKENPLPFKTKNLFCVGSPLGVFLSMRGGFFRTSTEVCERIYNVFYEHDFVGFRLEPLVHPNFEWIEPTQVRSADRELWKHSYADAPHSILKKSKEKKGAGSPNPMRSSSALQLIAEASISDADAVTQRIVSMEDIEMGSEALAVSASSSGRSTPISDGEEAPTSSGSRRKPSSIAALVEGIRDDGIEPAQRVDFALKPEVSWLSSNLYSAVFSAHFNYWYSRDLLTFLLSQLYPDTILKAKQDHEEAAKK